jgi:hypothetical protein
MFQTKYFRTLHAFNIEEGHDHKHQHVISQFVRLILSRVVRRNSHYRLYSHRAWLANGHLATPNTQMMIQGVGVLLVASLLLLLRLLLLFLPPDFILLRLWCY